MNRPHAGPADADADTARALARRLDMADAPATVAVVGPTASGKSALALAAALDGAGRPRAEIVSVDSALVYRGMDIGTAKPDAAERAAVPHHLIDLLDPAQRYSAARFVVDAQDAIAAAHARGRHALLVGGTMLYLKALRDGLDAMPASDPALQAGIAARAARDGWPALHAELATHDAATAARLHPTDAQRIQRALAVVLATGVPLSAWQRGAADAAPGRTAAFDTVVVLPPSRSALHARIAQRFDAMLDAGLLDEVAALRARADLSLELPSMRCVGYRQAWEAMDAAGTARTADAAWRLDAAARTALRAVVRERGIAATRQLAKRQLTWLRALVPGTPLV